MAREIKYFSMFSGIGGFELGIQRANQVRQTPVAKISDGADGSTDTMPKPDGTYQTEFLCVGYSEIDKYADATYQQHFGGHRNYGDATKINPGELPDFDLLVGGFPCQAFSVAGKRKGFNDTRGTLFFDIARILSEKRPRHLVLENVKGLLSHDSGKTFQTIIGVLTDLGYFVEWQVLNSKDFGVPQNRERVFIVGHLGGEPRRKVFPIFGENKTDTRPSEVTLVEARSQHGKPLQVYKQNAPTVQARYGTGGNNVPTVVRQPLRFLNRNQKNIEGDYAYTVDASQTSGVKQDMRIRRLTPLECERLQGFPDGWTVGSDTQRYKQCGNAVTVNVVEAVMSQLLKNNGEDTK